MALADVDLFLIRASYTEQPEESRCRRRGRGRRGRGQAGGQSGDGDTPSRPRRLAEVSLDVAVPHATGRPPALEVEDCTCPAGYRGASCQVRPAVAPAPGPGDAKRWPTWLVPVSPP